MFPDPVIIKAGGRDIAVEDSGPGSGFPIIMMNGAGSRHLFRPAVREGRDLGFRLIGYDRPGCGGSTSRPGRVIADCADDLRAIMTELGISRAAAWGSSGGGPYALAAAATMPDAIAAVCVFASVGPYGEPGLDFAEGLGQGMRETIRLFFAEPERARAEFRVQSAITLAERGSPEWWLQRWGDRSEQDPARQPVARAEGFPPGRPCPLAGRPHTARHHPLSRRRGSPQHRGEQSRCRLRLAQGPTPRAGPDNALNCATARLRRSGGLGAGQLPLRASCRPVGASPRACYWPTRPSMHSRSRSACPQWRAYSSIR